MATVESAKKGLDQQFSNLFQAFAYKPLLKHKQLIKADDFDGTAVKAQWNKTKNNFGPFIPIAKLVLAFHGK